jgi:hypothetical protein
VLLISGAVATRQLVLNPQQLLRGPIRKGLHAQRLPGAPSRITANQEGSAKTSAEYR